jgi:hypothetical protein
MFSAPTKTITIGSSSLRVLRWIRTKAVRTEENTYQGTIVIRKPTRAQTLREVIVLTVISTKAVNVTPNLEWTALMRPNDHTT